MMTVIGGEYIETNWTILLRLCSHLQWRQFSSDVVIGSQSKVSQSSYLNTFIVLPTVSVLSVPPTGRVLASQAEAIVRTGKHGHNIE